MLHFQPKRCATAPTRLTALRSRIPVEQGVQDLMRRLLGIADPLKHEGPQRQSHYLGFLIHACQVQVSRKSLVERIVADQADVIGYADACLPERILQTGGHRTIYTVYGRI